MKRQSLLRLTVVSLIRTALDLDEAHAAAAAVDQPAQTGSSTGTAGLAEAGTAGDRQSLETVVVTATALSVKKRDASYSVVVADAEEIKESNPKSTADLMKISPGIWPESTGGQTGANIEVTGFPSGGDAPFFTILMDGSPLYGMSSLFFFEHSSAFRLDDTIERVEIVQGGPSVVFADGQMGATANFILRRGTEQATASVGFTYGSEQLKRLDAFSGFKIAAGWYGSVGGFYRTSKGVRNPRDFPADDGGQITATLSHDWPNGSLLIYGRALNDKNQFIAPLPLIQLSAEHFSSYPAIDPLTTTYWSNAIRYVSLPNYSGGVSNANLANGRGADMQFFGGNLDLRPAAGWTLTDRWLIDGGDMDTNALFPSTNPATLANEISPNPAPGGYPIPPGSVVTATYVGGGTVDPNQSVIHQGWWFVHKHLFNMSNDLQLSKRLFEDNTLTAGVYIAHYSEDSTYSAFGNEMLMSNTPNARPIVVSYVSNGITYHRTDPQGFIDFSAFGGNVDATEHGTATNTAFYLADSWRMSRWRFDTAVRIEKEAMTIRVCNFAPMDLDHNPLNLYNKGVNTCNGTFTTTDYDPTRTSWTAGVNREVARDLSVYGRVDHGIHFLNFNGAAYSPTGQTAPELTIENVEVGLKYQAHWIYADLAAYRKIFSGLTYFPTNAEGLQIPGPPDVFGADSKGFNATMVVTPVVHFRLRFIGNYFEGRYSHFNACVPFPNPVTGPGCVVINGKPLQRQPKVHLALTPSYTVPLTWGELTGFVTYTYVGARTSDPSGLQPIGTYNTLDFGVVAAVNPNWEVRVQGTNLTNELGLTEGNSSVATAPSPGSVIIGRPLEGREVNIELKYKF
jgi:outer membrane receptor protein involved in Fe transport